MVQNSLGYIFETKFEVYSSSVEVHSLVVVDGLITCFASSPLLTGYDESSFLQAFPFEPVRYLFFRYSCDLLRALVSGNGPVELVSIWEFQGFEGFIEIIRELLCDF